MYLSVIADSLVVCLKGPLLWSNSHFPAQIYRCYSVWNNSKRVIVIPCFLLFGGTGEYFS